MSKRTEISPSMKAATNSPIVFVGTALKTLANSNIETSVVPTGTGSVTLPANFLKKGTIIRITGGGIFSTVLIPGSLTIKIKLGTVTLSTGVVNNLLSLASGNAFQFVCTIVCFSIGSTGTIIIDGNFNYATATLARGLADMNNAGAPVTINTAIQEKIDLTAKWATANANNTLTLTSMLVEAF